MDSKNCSLSIFLLRNFKTAYPSSSAHIYINFFLVVRYGNHRRNVHICTQMLIKSLINLPLKMSKMKVRLKVRLN